MYASITDNSLPTILQHAARPANLLASAEHCNTEARCVRHHLKDQNILLVSLAIIVQQSVWLTSKLSNTITMCARKETVEQLSRSSRGPQLDDVSKPISLPFFQARNMTKDARKHTVSNVKRQVAAKQSAKKRHEQALKYRNAETRAALDSQAQEIYAVSASALSSVIHYSRIKDKKDDSWQKYSVPTKCARGSC